MSDDKFFVTFFFGIIFIAFVIIAGPVGGIISFFAFVWILQMFFYRTSSFDDDQEDEEK